MLAGVGLGWSVAAQVPEYGPPAPAQETTSAGLESPPGIDERLTQAAATALVSYPSLVSARSQVRASEAEIDAARWLRFPSVDVTIATSDQRLGELNPDIEVFQPLWTGGRIAASTERSRASRAVAAAQLDEVSFDILARLAQAYYEIARTARLASIYRDSVEEHRRLVESMQRRVAQEVSPRTDLELASARMAQAEQELALVQTQEAIARRRFAELANQNGPTDDLPQYDPVAHHAVGMELIERAEVCNPTVRRFEAETSVAEAQRKLARAEVMPQIGAQYVRDRFGGDQLGIALRAQSNGGLSGFAVAEAAAARRDASEFAAVTARRELREAMELDLIENQTAKARIASSTVAASASLNVTRSYLRQFVTGRRTWLDVMNSVREAVSARAAMVEAETSAMASSARIHLRACEWLPSTGASAS